jgi:hypothetical protein
MEHFQRRRYLKTQNNMMREMMQEEHNQLERPIAMKGKLNIIQVTAIVEAQRISSRLAFLGCTGNSIRRDVSQ